MMNSFQQVFPFCELPAGFAAIAKWVDLGFCTTRLAMMTIDPSRHFVWAVLESAGGHVVC